MRLINGDALECFWNDKRKKGDHYSSDDIIDSIRDAKTVAYEWQTHADWVGVKTNIGVMLYTCSSCKIMIPMRTNYCPMCGSLMDGRRNQRDGFGL